MTMPEEHRRIDLILNSRINDKQNDVLISSLSKIDAIVDYKISGDRIFIEYLFPLISYSEIWTVLVQQLNKKQIGFIKSLRNSFRAYIEENERAHLTRQYGWEYNIRNIYITYFHQSDLDPTGVNPKHGHAYTRT
jgi:hypothetical protein